MKATPLKVNWLDPRQLMVVLLGSEGQSTKSISSYTGLSKSQVLYRLKLENVKRADYRNGTSAVARALIRHTQAVANQRLRQIAARSGENAKPIKPSQIVAPGRVLVGYKGKAAA